MEATLQALGRILLNGLPTFFLVILLHFYLKRTFFLPMQKTLAARFDATEGARKAAEQSLQDADKRIAEYQASIRAARGEIYIEQEKLRKELQEKQAAQLEAARQDAAVRLTQAKAQIEEETANARQTLAAESDLLANEIAESILQRRAA
ncbi:MAG: ATP synthase F0 subunit B [Acidobacteriota bacterium]|nr:ATP synthase F0 subunit B [Acidobacteriota bacterium]